MSDISNGAGEPQAPQQADLNQIEAIVSSEFQIEQALLEDSVPTYYLKQPQETKQPFLRLLKKLEPMNLIAFLRRKEGRIVLKIASKPPTRPSNVWINWVLLFATVGTTFATGYMLSSSFMDPLIGGVTFTVAIMAVLGAHEMGHKLTANRDGIDATPPYFIPGPPPVFNFFGIGTFGAVIMQKSLPRNRDSLFDVGASGPLIGFLIAVIAVAVGLPFCTYAWVETAEGALPTPLLFSLVGMFLPPFGGVPQRPVGDFMLVVNLHPVAFAGWVGLFVTMLNILPAAMLDGGHVSRSLVGDRARTVLAVLSVLFLIWFSLPMALFVVFMSMYKHPGPLDDVSALSLSRKLFVIALVVVFVLSSPMQDFVSYLLRLLGM